MIKLLRVLLWDEEIGRLAWDERRRLSYFTYNPEYVHKGLVDSSFFLLCKPKNPIHHAHYTDVHGWQKH